MARIIYPSDFPSQQTLFNNIRQKHVADGAASPLNPYLEAQGIDINALTNNGAQAAMHHTSGGLLSRQAENLLQLRDNRFNPIFARFKNEVQFLKTLYKGNNRGLGDWGITVNGESRIVYPAAFEDRVAMFNAFADKHLTYGFGDSPLQPYLTQHGIDLAADKAGAAQADATFQTYLAASRDAETETSARDTLQEPLFQTLRGIGDYLKKLYHDNAKSLGAWGFTVDDSPQAPRLRTSTLKIGEQITVSNVSVGGTFTNTGTGDLHLYRGKTTNGNPNIIHAGEQLGMIKGFSIITVVNPSTMIGGKFTVLSNKK